MSHISAGKVHIPEGERRHTGNALPVTKTADDATPKTADDAKPKTDESGNKSSKTLMVAKGAAAVGGVGVGLATGAGVAHAAEDMGSAAVEAVSSAFPDALLILLGIACIVFGEDLIVLDTPL